MASEEVEACEAGDALLLIVASEEVELDDSEVEEVEETGSQHEIYRIGKKDHLGIY
eukprot:CAMPEP_0170543958 /NCGR_PEP_ID=MMETSP0211-20121228/2899_1 /TAXON_ID=311385 /ORGANISM="Pseudokeronopsis sp., Strain OXSARD2" /LENGTH=55 /DNA_ID=CAMNT_0010847491 /DNA_START=1503 /DNA_END=1667 /DNA_ORIENTATION=-